MNIKLRDGEHLFSWEEMGPGSFFFSRSGAPVRFGVR